MYQAREILNKKPSEIWQLPERLSVQFDDGVVQTTNCDVAYSWYFWELHRRYPTTPLRKYHMIDGRRLNNRFNQNIMGPAIRDAFYASDKTLELERLWEIMQNAANRFYNEMSVELEPYVGTVSILDVLEIMDHPRIKEVMETASASRTGVERIYEVVTEVLMDPAELIGNPIAEGVKAKTSKLGQVLQCVSVRGFVTDVDSSMFPEPIMSGFVEGMTKLYWSMAESRSASKSLGLTKEPLQTAEYTSRRLQLATMNLQNLHYGDCGSTRYLNWHVTAKDLDKLVGKYYLTKDGLREVRENDRHLIGLTLQLRSPLHCNHPDRSGVCSTCFGELSYSLPAYTSVGWAMVVELAQKIAQTLMSNKHLDMSVSTDDIELTEHEERYLRTEPENNRIWLNRRVGKQESARIIIQKKEASGLGDITYTNDINTLNIQNVTAIQDIAISTTMKGIPDDAVLNVSMGKRLASLTHEALIYIKQRGYVSNEKGDYEVDLDQWNYDHPLFELPLRHVNMVDYANDIIAMVIGTTEKKGASSKMLENLKPLRSYDNVEDALRAFYSLVTARLDVNLVALECVILSLSSVDPENYDMRLPGAFDEPKLGSFPETIQRRSMSALLAYQEQQNTLYDPVTYVIGERPPHPMDALFLG